MPQSLSPYAAVAVPYLALEAAWLSFEVPRVYAPLFAWVQGSRSWKARPAPQLFAIAAAAYSLLTWGIVRFALGPAPHRDLTRGHAALRGASLGLLVYGTYNLTNLVAFEAYGWEEAAADTAWGALVLAAVAAIAREALARFGG
jgi:uncharacterized membrane protein